MTVRRAALIFLLALTALCGTAAGALAQTPELAAKLAACETGADAADRFAVFSGSMPRNGAASMAMRFDLFERVPGGGFEPVALDNWGVWERTAKKGVPGFIFTKRVEQLAAPAAFRAVVSYRWYDAKGRVTSTAKKTSPTCRQPDWRPDLHVRRVEPGTDGGPTKVVVRNTGRGAAGPFAVNVARSDFLKGASVAALPAGGQVTVAVSIGRCKPGESLTVTLDPAGAVEEADEADNTVTVACPAR
ncbi:MAG: CARDB domain-containing protein [Solirubrobacteraceae bacterium]